MLGSATHADDVRAAHVAYSRSKRWDREPSAKPLTPQVRIVRGSESSVWFKYKFPIFYL